MSYDGIQTANAPWRRCFSVTPDDDNDLAEVSRGLYVGGAGHVSVILEGDTTPQTFSNVGAGTVLPIRVKRVRSTGTTATLILGGN